ncbi:MAG: ABC transporter substrate-binding protein [Magnetococcales bacterium]|nr:ABC transporter substrate-binding protein [Magnetococcales bacterium]
MSKIFFLLLAFLVWPVTTMAGHGLSLDGKLKYAADFQHFEYVSPDAKIGGVLTLHSMGTFDKMNPFTLKGSAPDMLSELLFETLAASSMDEPFAQYGLLAEDIDAAADGLSVTYTLRPEAKFSDGTPVMAEDVKFSLETIQSKKSHPYYQSYWRDIKQAEVLGPRKIRFAFRQKNRELAMIAGQLPIFSKAYFTKHAFDKGGLDVPLGSGPYKVGAFSSGKNITYERNPDYWGWTLPVRRGSYNFQRIVVKYFKDPVVAMEAFKAGEYDFIYVNNSKQWARDYQGEKFDDGRIIKEKLSHKNGQGMQGFVYNLRRKMFQDPRTRQALTLAFDFEWSNKNQFYGQYTRSESYFSNSELAAQDGPPSQEELQLLEPLRKQLPAAVFKPVVRPPSTLPPHSLRKNLRKAKRLLKEAGWKMGPERVLVNQEGRKLEISFLLSSPAFERILAPYTANLKKLGVKLDFRTVDMSLYQHRVEKYDYDMIVSVFSQSQSPGNEQRTMWHSSSVQMTGGRNTIGLQDPAVDVLVDHIIYAEDRAGLVTACRALDRVLMAGFYLVPNWHIPYHRIAYWNRFERPKKLPLYYSPDTWLHSWWVK